MWRDRCLIAAVAALGWTACKFDLPPEHEVDASLADAEPDAAPPCEPNTIECIDAESVYVECSAEGTPERVIYCPLGCAAGMERCVDVAPSNGLAGYLDQARDDADVVDVVFSGAATIDSDSGAVVIGGVSTQVPTAVANGIRVLMFKSVDVSGTVKVTGTLPVAFVADGDIRVTGLLDVSADGAANGPGAVAMSACLGNGELYLTNPKPGGGGGGRFHPGGASGAAYDGPASWPGGDAMSDPDLVPLVGGCRGGSAGGIFQPPPPPSGGGGGGAVQLTARGTISIVSAGKIDASGGGPIAMQGAGPGGGSGGAVLLEAPTIILDGPGAVISTKGGSGAGARSQNVDAPGQDGGTGPDPAPGGSLTGYATGGPGGTETAAPGVGGSGNATNPNGAGGGGSVGEARFNSANATISPANGAAIRSRYSTGTIGSRLVP